MLLFYLEVLTYTVVTVRCAALLAVIPSVLLRRNLQFQLASLTLSIIHSRLPVAPFRLKALLAYAPFHSVKRARLVNKHHVARSVLRIRPADSGNPNLPPMQNGVALEQSSSRDKPQQGQANRINPLETYPKLLLHHSRASGLAPLYVHGQIERVVAQDSSPALPYCSVLRDDCEAMIIRMVRARDDSRAKEGCGYLVGEYNDTEDAAMR